jgi:hypothetical protein
MQNGISKLDVSVNGKEKNVAFVIVSSFHFKISVLLQEVSDDNYPHLDTSVSWYSGIK